MNPQDYELIKKEVLTLLGVDLNFYKGPQMQRRLGTYLLRTGQTTWTDFFKSIRNDPKELRKLKDYLTINVSSFFRDPPKYDYLRNTVFPELLGKNKQKLRVWSAGCSLGQEPYTLAMILSEITGAMTQHYILATDLDRTALDKAEAGGPYTADDVSNVPPQLLEQYFTHEAKGYFVKPVLQRKINFKQHNLLSDPFENNFDLIVCRNVVIYFTAEVKDLLYKRFSDSLRVGGILFVGGTEIVSQATGIGLQTAGISFYRRTGS